MAIITIAVLFLICIISYMNNKNIFNPIFMLSGFWLIIVFLSSMGLFGVMQPTFTAYLVTLLGAICYALGGLCFANIRFVTIGKSLKNNSYMFVPKRFCAFVITMLIYEAYRFVDVFRMLRRGYSLNMIRLVYFGIDVDGFKIGRFESIMETYVHLPLLYACMAVLALETVITKENKSTPFLIRILGYAWIGMAQIIMGGRIVIYIFAIELLIAYFITRNKHFVYDHPGKKKKILIISLIGLAIAFVYWLSISRTGNKDYPFLRSMYVDFCGCMAHMSLRFENIDFDYTYGISLLSGVLRPFMLVYN